MTVKELIIELLSCDMNKEVSVEYPAENKYSNNYYKYVESDRFKIVECNHGVIIGIEE